VAYRDGRTSIPVVVGPAADDDDDEEEAAVDDDLSLLTTPPLLTSVEEVGPRRSDWNTESMVDIDVYYCVVVCYYIIYFCEVGFFSCFLCFVLCDALSERGCYS